MDRMKGYHMSIGEVFDIVTSIKKRGIKIDTIELTGGEPSLWVNLEKGVKLFKTVCKNITVTTNGNDLPRIIAIDWDYIVVSASQATEKQLSVLSDYKGKVVYNKHSHKKVPEIALENVLPAECGVASDPFKNPQTMLAYVRGKIYYCCNTVSLLDRVPLTKDLVCDFKADFVKYFRNRKFDKEICRYCLANAKVWCKI
jgi:hypothetical protein